MKETVKKFVEWSPFLRSISSKLYWHTLGRVNRTVFQDSASYWEQRYTNGGDSGVGSFGCFARFKADVINDFVARHPVHTVIEFGCGDGNQLSLAEYPTYIGYDISTTAIEKCISKFLADHTKSFRLLSEYVFEKADLVLSLDVIYHLVEDEVFETYMQTIFGASYQYVIIYSSNLMISDSLTEII
jgi:cyclopropane fatty-acyl-phospholipid synthase-like methyltransferase